jgi:hypothetical protein
MIDDYHEVFAAFKGRGRALLYSFDELMVYFKNVFKWVKLRVSVNVDGGVGFSSVV